MCPNSSNTNSTVPNENGEQISPIATPLIEMGFSARLVQRAIDAIGMILWYTFTIKYFIYKIVF